MKETTKAVHTPGPWYVTAFVRERDDAAPSGSRLRIVSNNSDVADGYVICAQNASVCELKRGFRRSTASDAALIAAAPDLAAALLAVEGLLDNFPGFDSRAVPFTSEATGNIGYVVRAALRRAGLL